VALGFGRLEDYLSNQNGGSVGVLRPGEVFRSRTTCRFGVSGAELADRIRF
jgi:hypothetical protein